MSTHVSLGLLGAGRLYEALKQHLAEVYALSELDWQAMSAQVHLYRLVIVCHDLWSPALYAQTQELGRIEQVAWLPLYGEPEAIFLGPFITSGSSGCFACAEHRRLCAIADQEMFLALREGLEQGRHRSPRFGFTSWELQAVCLRVAYEVEAHLASTGTKQAVLRLQRSTLQWSRHRFLPDPACPMCGDRPADSAKSARIELQSRQKLRPETSRTRSLRKLERQMLETYVDREFGLIHHVGRHTQAVCSIVDVYAGMQRQHERRELPGIGRTLDYQQSHLAAIAEALERYGGQVPHSKRTVVHGSFRQLAEWALDPATLVLHSPEQYALPDYWFIPYRPDSEYSWVWGYSFSQQRSLLIPEFYAYYGSRTPLSFAYEISNGCALGSCLEEAILYALLEVLERDAFLLTWYARLGVPCLDRSTIPSQRVRWLVERLEYTSGYTLSIFTTTLLHGAPCCWVMAVDEAHRPGFPRMACAAGSHVLPEEAIMSALLELAPALQPQRLQEQFQQNQQHALAMLHDSRLVRHMEDHAMLYMLPEAFERLDFLMQASYQQSFQDAFAHLPAPSQDLTEDLVRLIDFYRAQGIDTIVVDQTTPEQRALGFHCVKVIMPGMLPMTFGHEYRRIHDCKRLAEWPMLMGYRARPLIDGEINPYPHPFP